MEKHLIFTFSSCHMVSPSCQTVWEILASLVGKVFAVSLSGLFESLEFSLPWAWIGCGASCKDWRGSVKCEDPFLPHVVQTVFLHIYVFLFLKNQKKSEVLLRWQYPINQSLTRFNTNSAVLSCNKIRETGLIFIAGKLWPTNTSSLFLSLPHSQSFLPSLSLGETQSVVDAILFAHGQFWSEG